MGQKVNPIAVRLNFNRFSDSSWFSDYYYSYIFHQDLNYRQYLSLIKQPNANKLGLRTAKCTFHHFPKRSVIHLFCLSDPRKKISVRNDILSSVDLQRTLRPSKGRPESLMLNTEKIGGRRTKSSSVPGVWTSWLQSSILQKKKALINLHRANSRRSEKIALAEISSMKISNCEESFGFKSPYKNTISKHSCRLRPGWILRLEPHILNIDKKKGGGGFTLTTPIVGPKAKPLGVGSDVAADAERNDESLQKSKRHFFLLLYTMHFYFLQKVNSASVIGDNKLYSRETFLRSLALFGLKINSFRILIQNIEDIKYRELGVLPVARTKRFVKKKHSRSPSLPLPEAHGLRRIEERNIEVLSREVPKGFYASVPPGSDSFLNRLRSATDRHEPEDEVRRKVTLKTYSTDVLRPSVLKTASFNITKSLDFYLSNISNILLRQTQTILKLCRRYGGVSAPQAVAQGAFISLRTAKVQSIFQSAFLIAQEIACKLEQKKSFRLICRLIFQQLATRRYIKGIRIACSGRINGAEIAKTECRKFGETSLHVFSEKIDYATAKASTPYGILGVKVWISYI